MDNRDWPWGCLEMIDLLSGSHGTSQTASTYSDQSWSVFIFFGSLNKKSTISCFLVYKLFGVKGVKGVWCKSNLVQQVSFFLHSRHVVLSRIRRMQRKSVWASSTLFKEQKRNMTLVIQFPLSGGHLSASSKKSCVIIVGVGWFCGHTPFIRSWCVFVYKKKTDSSWNSHLLSSSVRQDVFFQQSLLFWCQGAQRNLSQVASSSQSPNFKMHFRSLKTHFLRSWIKTWGLGKKNSWNGVRLRRAHGILLKYDQLESSPIPSEKQIYTILIYNGFCYSIFGYVS